MRSATNVIRLPGAAYDLTVVGVEEVLTHLLGDYQEKREDLVLIAHESEAFAAGKVSNDTELPVIMLPGKSDTWAIAGKFHTMWSGDLS
jgi:hypothetical protein